MPIQYKLRQRSEPGIVGGGNKKWYAVAINNKEFTIDNLVASIEKFSSLSEPDIRAVIIAMENVIQNQLTDGYIVRLDKLGSFYTSLSSEGVVDKQSFKEEMIKEKRVIYRPGSRILKALHVAKCKEID
jgi:predicted histone-like DNA-binding protein